MLPHIAKAVFGVIFAGALLRLHAWSPAAVIPGAWGVLFWVKIILYIWRLCANKDFASNETNSILYLVVHITFVL